MGISHHRLCAQHQQSPTTCRIKHTTSCYYYYYYYYYGYIYFVETDNPENNRTNKTKNKKTNICHTVKECSFIALSVSVSVCRGFKQLDQIQKVLLLQTQLHHQRVQILHRCRSLQGFSHQRRHL